MRLLYTYDDQKKGFILSNFLQKEGIENQLEIVTNTDWGSPEYGNVLCRIWVIDEDQVEEANNWIDAFNENPEDPRFQLNETRIGSILKPLQNSDNPNIIPPTVPSSYQMGPLTILFFLCCCLVFLVEGLTPPSYLKNLKTLPPNIPEVPLLASPVYKAMSYDYPKAYEIIDKLVKIFGIEKLQNPNELPSNGKELLNEFNKTPYWKGFYEKLVLHKISLKDLSNSAPLFEKIREGEVWRLFSPCLLHGSIFHIFFNMIWLLVLGKQIEYKIKGLRYLFFILITGIISNTAQYLVSGPNFVGFSGVLSAMIGFVWMRQRLAAWEGYYLEPGTFNLILIFILGLFFLQITSFFIEFYTKQVYNTGIANTAHLVGGACGLIFGRFNFFSAKNL